MTPVLKKLSPQLFTSAPMSFAVLRLPIHSCLYVCFHLVGGLWTDHSANSCPCRVLTLAVRLPRRAQTGCEGCHDFQSGPCFLHPPPWACLCLGDLLESEMLQQQCFWWTETLGCEKMQPQLWCGDNASQGQHGQLSWPAPLSSFLTSFDLMSSISNVCSFIQWTTLPLR